MGVCAAKLQTAVVAYTHGGGTAGEPVLNAQACPGSDVVVEFFEEFIPAIIDGEEKFGRPRDVHVAEYKTELLACPGTKPGRSACKRYCSDGSPLLTIINTQPEFFWLVNYQETVLSAEFRGMAGLQDAMQAGCGNLLSFKSTDSIPSLLYARDYYTDGEAYFIGASIPSTEHRVMCIGSAGMRLTPFV